MALRSFLAVAVLLPALAAPLPASEYTIYVEGELRAQERQELVAELKKLEVDLHFVDTPLRDVLAFLGETTEYAFAIDPDCHKQRGDNDLPITITIEDFSLFRALPLLLSLQRLILVYTDGVFMVQPVEYLQRRMTIRIYEVSDLLVRVEDFPAPEIEPAEPEPGGV